MPFNFYLSEKLNSPYTPHRRWRKAIAGGLVGLATLLAVAFIIAPPLSFPVDSYMYVEEGTTMRAAAEQLRERGIIRSELLFMGITYLFGGQVVTGEYYFPRRQSVVSMAHRFAYGEHQVEAIRVTIPEGLSAREIGELLGTQVPDFNASGFALLAQQDEGRLFPDTYFIFPGELPAMVHKMLRETFDRKIQSKEVQEAIASFGKPLDDVITMASILEREAMRMEDRRVIAGILWKRIELGMPLQVDAAFTYALGKGSLELTKNDLQDDSPYNTYTNKGLPPGPIGNPGLDSILAAVTPVETSYLFFLSDRQGNFHFSVNHDQHVRYKEQYLGS